MFELLNEGQIAALIGGMGGILLGLAARMGRFCTLGAIEDKNFGETPKILRAIFDTAKEHGVRKPCVLFIDEIDGIMRTRRDDDQACTYGMKTEFLQLLDGVQPSHRVVIVGCTNFVHALDPALLRRFQTVHKLNIPHLEERREIIRLLAPTMTEEQCDSIARFTEGDTGSRLKDRFQKACQLRIQRAMQTFEIDDRSTAADLVKHLPAFTMSDWQLDTAATAASDSVESPPDDDDD